MSVATQDLANKHNNLVTQFRGVLDEELGAIRTEIKPLLDNPLISGEGKQTIARMENALQKQEQEIKQLQILAKRPTLDLEDKSEKANNRREKKARKEAFNNALRLGSWGRLPEEQKKYVELDAKYGLETKTLFAADGTTGGFLATPEYVNQLIKLVVLISPIRQYCDVRVTSNPYIMIPKRTQTASAVRVAEQATRTETQNPKFGLVQVFPYEAYALTLVSITDLDDSSLDLGQFVMDEFAEQFAKLEGSEIINGLGAGAGQCSGFLVDTNVTAASNYTLSGTSGAVAYGTLITLMHSMKTAYRIKGQATWGFSTQTLGAIRALTDTTGRPLWIPFGGSDLPGQLWGYNYVELPDMPAVSSGNFAIIFGNFKLGYQVVIRKQISIQVLRERYIDSNAVGYIGWYRFGGAVKLAEALKPYKIT